MSANNNGLSLPAVVDRFTESGQVLGHLNDKLRKIIIAEEGATRNSELLDVAATRLAELTSALSSLVAEIADSQASVKDACQTAEAFLESTDLRRMDQRLEQVESRAQEIQAVLKEQGKELKRSMEAVGESLSRDIRQLGVLMQGQGQQLSGLNQRVDYADQRTASLVEQLDLIKGVLPGRQQKRL